LAFQLRLPFTPECRTLFLVDDRCPTRTDWSMNGANAAGDKMRGVYMDVLAASK